MFQKAHVKKAVGKRKYFSTLELKALLKYLNLSLQEITALKTFEALLLHISISWMRGTMHFLCCLVVKLFRRFKGLISREKESISLSLFHSIHPSSPLLSSLPLLNPSASTICIEDI